MNTIPTGFTEFLARNNIAWAVVSFAPYEEKRVFGDHAVLESSDIVKQYFGDIERLNESLEGRILPSTVQQGTVAGVICKPAGKAIVGMLYQENRDAVQCYRQSKKLDEELRSLWAAGKATQ